jgi:hypothetical protein
MDKAVSEGFTGADAGMSGDGDQAGRGEAGFRAG